MSAARTLREASARLANSDASSQFTPSEIGPIPVGWDTAKLGDILHFQNGVNADAKAYGSGISFANVLEVLTHSHLKATHIPGCVKLSQAQIRSYRVRRGDVLFNRTSETDEEVGLSSVYADEADIVFGGFVIRGRFKTDDFDPTYCGYAWRHQLVRSQIIARGQGAVRANIGQADLRTVVVPKPPEFEQRHIAEALSDADALIEVLGALLSKKRAIKQGAMQELLSGRRRLPGFTGEWRTEPLARLGEVLNGLTYSPEDVSDSGTLVLRSSNIQNDALSFDDNVFVRMDVPQQSTARENDILICVRNGSRGLIGKSVKLDERCTGMAFGAFMAVLRTDLHDFILHQFRSDFVKRQISEHLGATINQITNKSLKSFIVPMPPTEEEAFAVSRILSEMEREIEALQVKLTKARQIKLGMMQDLLTGRTRLL